MNLTPYLDRYEQLVAEVDAVFAKVAAAHADCVACRPGCGDCCHALFDLSLIEAVYLNHKFTSLVPFGPLRSNIMSTAADADRDLTRMKKEFFQTLKQTGGEPQAVDLAVGNVMQHAAKARVRCPLLADGDLCALYDWRPVTCRLYGIPTAIAGKGHVCGLSAFRAGQGYPTVHMDKIQDRLDQLSLDLQQGIESRFTELHKVYVPVSMALLTRYDDAYLGVGPAPEER